MAEEHQFSPLAEALIASYTQEAEMYQALLFLAREQGGLLRTGRGIGEYAALLPRKDRLLRAIGQLEAELEPLKRRWSAARRADATAAPEARERLHGLLDGILGTIQAIREQEARNGRLLEGRERSARPTPRPAAHSARPDPGLTTLTTSCAG